MPSLEEMREQASPEENIKIYSTFNLGGLALMGIGEGVYFGVDHNSYLQAVAAGGLLLVANYGRKLVNEIRSLRNNKKADWHGDLE